MMKVILFKSSLLEGTTSGTLNITGSLPVAELILRHRYQLDVISYVQRPSMKGLNPNPNPNLGCVKTTVHLTVCRYH